MIALFRAKSQFLADSAFTRQVVDRADFTFSPLQAS